MPEETYDEEMDEDAGMIGIPLVVDNEKKNATPKYKSEWDSGLAIVDRPTIAIPYRLLMICNAIQDKFDGKEFSILVQGQWTETEFVVGTDFVIPKQTVRSAEVAYDEDLTIYKKQGYNVIIHSHPFAMHEFSNDDTETINTHFDASILYSQGNFVKAVMAIKMTDSLMVHMECDIDIMDDVLNNIDTSNITVYKYEYPYNNTGKKYKSNKENAQDDLAEEEWVRIMYELEKNPYAQGDYYDGRWYGYD